MQAMHARSLRTTGDHLQRSVREVTSQNTFASLVCSERLTHKGTGSA